MTMGLLLDRNVERNRTASFGGSTVVVVAIVVVKTGVVVISLHS